MTAGFGLQDPSVLFVLAYAATQNFATARTTK
jgi:hypothetical protein